MTNAARNKGTLAERLVVEYLNSRGLASHRLPLSSPKGDVEVFNVECAVEVKNHKRMDLASWLNQAMASARAKGVVAYAVIHKRIRMARAEDWYATLPMWYLADLWQDQKQYHELLNCTPARYKVDL